MLTDRYGKEVIPGDWFIRLDQNNEGRLYIVEGYPKSGHVAVHEHVHKYEPNVYPYKIIGIQPARLKQIIKLPTNVLWYPRDLLPEIGERVQ